MDRIIDEVKAVSAQKSKEGQHAQSAGLSSVLGELISQDPEMVSIDITGEHNEYHLRISLSLAKELRNQLEGMDL